MYIWFRCRFHHHTRGPIQWIVTIVVKFPFLLLLSLTLAPRLFFFSDVYYFSSAPATHIFPSADSILCLVISFFSLLLCFRSSHHFRTHAHTSLYDFVVEMWALIRPRIFTNFCNIVKFLYCLSFVFRAVFGLPAHTPQIQQYKWCVCVSLLVLGLWDWLHTLHTKISHLFCI